MREEETVREGGRAAEASKWKRALFALIGLMLGGLLLSLVWRATADDPAADVAGSLPVSVETTASVEATTSSPPPVLAVGSPKRLKIPAIGVDAPIESVGLAADGSMASPEGAETTGWYKRGPRPGEQGSAVIAGHSGYRTGPAVFDDLPKLSEGDRIYVVGKDGESIGFRVVRKREYAPDAEAKEVFSDKTGRYLNLVTCTGAWDASTRSHSKRLVVFAEAVQPDPPDRSRLQAPR